MSVVGVVCEYNPFHNGHARQIAEIRGRYGSDCTLVCLMSGNFVQRGEPAVFSKEIRAEAALRCGADLVLELPVTVALSSAEGFAAGGVEILNAVGCRVLSFGSECGDAESLMRAAKLHLRPEFDEGLRQNLSTGCSYPAAREMTLRRMGAGDVVSRPNDILGVEYCKAILRQNCSMEIMTLNRGGDYHALKLDRLAPSATALRAAMETGADWSACVPAALQSLYDTAVRFTLRAGERAVLARVRTLPDSAFQTLPFGSEGLWSRLMKSCRSCAGVEELLNAAKSKRYTRTRLQRMLICACLGLTAADLALKPPYVRILGFTRRGRELIRKNRDLGLLVNAGQTPPEPGYYAKECAASDFFGLFAEGEALPCGREQRLRVLDHSADG